MAMDSFSMTRCWPTVRTDGSFCSANDPRVLFGLGASATVDRVLVVWPNGSEEQWTEVATGRYTVLRRGEGSPAGGELLPLPRSRQRRANEGRGRESVGEGGQGGEGPT